MNKKLDYTLVGINISVPVAILILLGVGFFQTANFLWLPAIFGPALFIWFIISIPLIFSGLFLWIAVSTQSYLKIARPLNILMALALLAIVIHFLGKSFNLF